MKVVRLPGRLVGPIGANETSPAGVKRPENRGPEERGCHEPYPGNLIGVRFDDLQPRAHTRQEFESQDGERVVEEMHQHRDQDRAGRDVGGVQDKAQNRGHSRLVGEEVDGAKEESEVQMIPMTKPVSSDQSAAEEDAAKELFAMKAGRKANHAAPPPTTARTTNPQPTWTTAHPPVGVCGRYAG